ncbi:hypothetical protein GQ600_2355 [Phytophthora cactorum]|nr:hypothetical protein GQ600_2355 [Phytophthora cactorum]
MERTSSH